MKSRMSKYDNENTNYSRVRKNEELYKEINKTELENFNVRSNATVIGNQSNEIDIAKIKKILDMKYKESPKRKSIRLETPDEEPIVSESPTKEYDLNVILEKAKDDKEESYEEARVKKLRDTQFDILKNLKIKDEEEIDKKEEDLMNLINTITINEAKKREEKENSEPLDILSDLKGDENTEVFEGIKEEIERIEKTSKVLTNNSKIDDSFYTTSNLFNKKDFTDDDFDDEKLSIGVKILIVIVVIVFLVGLFLFLKSIIGF